MPGAGACATLPQTLTDMKLMTGRLARQGWQIEGRDAVFLVAFAPPLLPGLFKHRTSPLNDLRGALGRDVDLIRMSTIRNRYRMNSINRDREPVYEA